MRKKCKCSKMVTHSEQSQHDTREALFAGPYAHPLSVTDIDLEEAVDLFAKKYPRRLELGTLLKDHDDQHC